jgi:hypothetical protein
VRFSVQGAAERTAVDLTVRQLVIAGWTGRDTVALQHHIAELRQLGVAAPSSTPIFYRVSAARLLTRPVIEVTGENSSGEVECVLVQFDGRLYVGVGSDHTDRSVESYSVAIAKQVCDKPIAADLWDFADVREHWDDLLLRSWIVVEGERVLYQEGSVSALREPADLIVRFAGEQGLAEGTVMFCGTLAAQGGIRPSRRFDFELEDPVLRRRIRSGYDVLTLPLVE